MKRLQRLEFIFLYERFLQRNNDLNRAVVEGKSDEEIRFLRSQVNEMYNRMRDQRSASGKLNFFQAQ